MVVEPTNPCNGIMTGDVSPSCPPAVNLMGPAIRTPWRRGLTVRLGSGDANDERGAVGDVGLAPHFAVVSFHNGSADREAHPEPVRLS